MEGDISDINNIRITSTEMHSGGEPLRIIESGWPLIPSSEKTLMQKRRYVRQFHDHIRKFIMHEPRGHHDMYGALILQADHPQADFAVLFMHNDGYSTMCGHAMMALGRYAVDRGLVPGDRLVEPEVKVKVQCPCGLVTLWTKWKDGKSGGVRFHSVPAFSFATDVDIEIPGFKFRVDIGYGGTFYAVVKDSDIGVDVNKSSTNQIVRMATLVSEAVRSKVKLSHPSSDELGFLYGTIVTDGNDDRDETTNLTIFADREVDRAPTGSGVTARVAIQHAKGLIKFGEVKKFKSAATGEIYEGKVVEVVEDHDLTNVGSVVVVEVSGNGYYCGSSTFVAEIDDPLKGGFLLK